MNSESKKSGTAGLRWMQCTINGLPSPPERDQVLQRGVLGSKRRMKPTWMSGRSSAASFCTIAYADTMSVVNGFSQNTGFPASRHALHLTVMRGARRRDQHRVNLGVIDRGDRIGHHPRTDGGGHLLGLLGEVVVDHRDLRPADAPAQGLDVEGAHHPHARAPQFSGVG